MAASASIATRLALLEQQVSDLRKRSSQTPTQEVAWRMHAAERELRIQAELDAAQAREALQAIESICAEMEGLVWFLRGKPTEALMSQ